MECKTLTFTSRVSLLTASLLLYGCGFGANADLGDDSSLLRDQDRGEEQSEENRCGSNVCGAGEYCCNASCGMCAKTGEACIQIACEDDGTDPGYDPCEGKSCGEPCALCPPDATDCAETADLKACDEGGVCRSGVPSCDAGERCGTSQCAAGEVCCNDSCGICTPPGGACTQQLCGGDSGTPEYDPCEGKVCGDACALCPPDATDCAETTELKACDESGVCRSAVPSCGEREGERCGSTRCAVGEVCCNDSCGICTPPGGGCTQQICSNE